MAQGFAEPEYVVVPAYPAVTGDRKDVRFELRDGHGGEPVGVAFTTVARLVDQLGRCQPWLVLTTRRYRELLARVRVREILLDPEVDAAAPRWSAQTTTALLEANHHGWL